MIARKSRKDGETLSQGQIQGLCPWLSRTTCKTYLYGRVTQRSPCSARIFGSWIRHAVCVKLNFHLISAILVKWGASVSEFAYVYTYTIFRETRCVLFCSNFVALNKRNTVKSTDYKTPHVARNPAFFILLLAQQVVARRVGTHTLGRHALQCRQVKTTEDEERSQKTTLRSTRPIWKPS